MLFACFALATLLHCGRAFSTPLQGRPGASFASVPYVIGGTAASPGEFPHQLALHLTTDPSGSNLKCGATLISATEALTAAHCVDGLEPSTLYITAGVHNRDDSASGQKRQLSAFTVHADYCNTCGGTPNDIAVIYWTEPVDLDEPFVGVARLPDNNDNDLAGDTCVISGWGRTAVGIIIPNELQKANISVIFNDECSARVDGLHGAQIFSHQICLYNSAQDTATCNADSGGPLNCPLDDPNDDRTHFVAGIASWEIIDLGDCMVDYPSIYIRVASFLDWIKENTQGV